MASRLFPNHSERFPKINRRHLLTTAASVAANATLRDITPSETGAVDPVPFLAIASEAPLNFSASTARRLLEIECRNELRREAELPLLSIPKDYYFALNTSGANLTFESSEGFPPDSIHASLAHAKRNFHYSQAR